MRGWGHNIWRQTHNLDIQRSHEQSATVPFEEREGMEGEHNPEKETNLRHHQVLEEGDKLESSFLEVGQMMFSGSPESGHTFVADFVECTEIAFGQICFAGREGKLFQSNCLTTGFSVPWAGRRVG